MEFDTIKRADKQMCNDTVDSKDSKIAPALHKNELPSRVLRYQCVSL